MVNVMNKIKVQSSKLNATQATGVSPAEVVGLELGPWSLFGTLSFELGTSFSS
jgi:hypothetical protein